MTDVLADPSPPKPAPVAATQTTLIRARPGWQPIDLAELWRYRELIGFLIWRDIKVRYKQTALGAAWAVIQPLMMALVFTLIFGRWAKLPSDGKPYLLFAFCAMLPWQLFAHALTQGGNSVVVNERLVSKVYFPRLIIPLATVLGGVMDFLVASLILVAMMVWFGVWGGAAILAAPLFVVMGLAASVGVALWLSALNVQYRDVRYTVTFLTQLWLFATPVLYPATVVPEQYRLLWAVNPMVGVVEGFRWAMLGTSYEIGGIVAVSAASTLLILIGGLFFFRRIERSFSDVL